MIFTVTEPVCIPTDSELGFLSPHSPARVYYTWLLDDSLAVLRIKRSSLGKLHEK